MASRKEYEMLFRLNAQMGSSYSKTFSEAKSQLSGFSDEIAALAKTQGDITAYQKQQTAIEATQSKLQMLQQQYANLQQEMTEAGTASADLKNKMLSKQQQIERTTSTLNKQNTKLDEMGRELRQAGVNTDDLTASSKELQTRMQSLQREAEDTAEAANGLGSVLSDVVTGAAYTAGAALLNMAADALMELPRQFVEATEAAISFESAMTGVSKTTDMTDAELSAMADEIQQMSTEMPATAEEIAAVAESAGQLGIAKEDLLDFTETMIMLGTSTNMSADEAATSLARFANITGTTADNYSRLGAVIVDLGNNFATTESEITEMATRIASAGTLAGFSESDILALSAAMSSVGIEAEAGGTAMTQTINAIVTAVEAGGESLDQFADVAGLTSTEFAELWSASPIQALQTFVSGLGDLEDEGESATLVLDEMGLSSVRQSNMLRSLSLAADEVSDAISTANTAWEENTALTNEAEKRYETTESKLEMLKNAWTELQVTIGEEVTPVVEAGAEVLTEVLGNVSDAMAGTKTEAERYAAAVETIGDLDAYQAAYQSYLQLSASIDDTTMSASELETAEAELAAVKQQLIDLSGGMITAAASENDELAEQAGLVNQIVESQREQTQNEMRNALLEGAQDYTDALAETANAEEALATARAEQSGILEDQIAYMDTYSKMLNDYQSLETAVGAGLLDTVEGTAEYNQRLQELSETMSQLTGQDLSFDTLAAASEYYDDIVAGSDEVDQAAQDNAKHIEELEAIIAQNAEDTAEYASRVVEYINTGAVTAEEAAELFGISMADIEEAMDLATQAAEEQADAMEDTESEASKLEAKQEKLAASAEGVAEAVAAGKVGFAEARQYMADLGDTTSESQYAVEAFDDSMTAALETLWGMEAAEYAEQQIGGVTDAIQALVDQWDSAYESVSGQVGLFDNMTPDESDVVAVEDLTEALRTQAEYFQTYQDNLQKAAEMGLAEDLLQSLSDGSTESAEYLDAIVNGGQDAVDDINAQWAETSEAKNSWAENLADMQTDFDAAMDAIVEANTDAVAELNQSDEAATAARETMQAYIAELDENGSTAAKRARYWATVIGASLGGTSTYTGDVAEHAEGGIFTAPHLGMVAEAGPEAVIPLTGSNGLSLWAQAGQMLGALSTPASLPSTGGSGDVVINFSPQYRLDGVSSAAGVAEVLAAHDEQMRDMILSVVQQAQVDANRRAYV